MPNANLNKYVKVRFALDPTDWHGRPSETLWAVPLEQTENQGSFELANTPFFAKGVSFCDIVSARLSREDFDRDIFDFEAVKKSGRHSTYMILIDGSDKPALWQELERIGCSYESKTILIEGVQKNLLAVDVPPQTDIFAVYAILDRGEKSGHWVFQEGHVGHPITKTNRA